MSALLVSLALGVAPASASSLLVRVHDPAGAPLSGAQVACGSRVLLTDAAGRASFTSLAPGSDCTVRAPLRQTVQLSNLNLPPGESHRIVELPPAPGSLKVVALDEDYEPIDATLRFLAGPAPQGPVPLGADGEHRLELTPGTWRVLVVDGHNTPVEAELDIAPGAARSILARFPRAPEAVAAGPAPRRLELPELVIVADAEPRALELGIDGVDVAP